MPDTTPNDNLRLSEGWPTAAQIGAMQAYEFAFWQRGMGDAFPTAQELEDAGNPAKVILLGQEDRRWVYFVQAENGPVKIGVAADVRKRVGALRTASPIALELKAKVRGGRRLECKYHECFAAHRLHGEWFAPHPDILAEITRLQDKGE